MDLNLTIEEIEKAAIAAASTNWIFSNDRSIDREDLVQMAFRRIIERDPLNIATAVHVGREGILREVGYKRHQNAGNTINLSAVTHQDANDDADSELAELGRERVTKTRPDESFQRRKIKVRNLKQKLGDPITFFGRFGIAYPLSKEVTTADEFSFTGHSSEIPRSFLEQRYNERLKVYTTTITKRLKAIANRHYVLAYLQGK